MPQSPQDRNSPNHLSISYHSFFIAQIVGFLSAARYVPQLSKAIDSPSEASSMFVRYIFIDQACFHCAVATSILCLNDLVTRKEGILQAMSHISHTFRLINQRLSGQEAISDTTMAVIVSMAQYERHQNEYQRGFVHVQALRRMVQLQGGLLQVTKSNHILVQKMLRVDLEYALQLGSSTLFSLEDAIETNRIIHEIYGDKRQNHACYSKPYRSPLLGSLRRDIQDVFFEVTSLASMLNDANNGVGPKLKSCVFHSDLLVLGYRLGNMYTLGMKQAPVALISCHSPMKKRTTAVLSSPSIFFETLGEALPKLCWCVAAQVSLAKSRTDQIQHNSGAIHRQQSAR
ncbi:hypothetical protein KXW98_006467 [Aspergillus fumigatus]|uniref:Uncharacterized protein n=1 Tax=Aspergillus fumigatus TaxID=746128 RepID=A0A9P8N7Z6_ASPFM|nr:hypothetical protein CNMCM8714_007402 [Aspergillus fumigatus]KAH1296358.1 hypothetical protein KXX48_000911 [Aspergillus fumigatus]KAH1324162.1 hypothetical protein KXX66_006881 [Aspergillus fumigatus]KAH1344059.1 hypothetical protein KXX67_004292 [Aspergillus fumigatus]KAH1366108.1 hypothetical protein KXX63_003611 [Aspergillus fumigatus]